jgi:putative spermidine/putrescine transport system ATP-binding protein
MYAHLADGSEISVRGAIRGGTVSGLPTSGEPVTLALDAADTIMIDGSDD